MDGVVSTDVRRDARVSGEAAYELDVGRHRDAPAARKWGKGRSALGTDGPRRNTMGTPKEGRPGEEAPIERRAAPPGRRGRRGQRISSAESSVARSTAVSGNHERRVPRIEPDRHGGWGVARTNAGAAHGRGHVDRNSTTLRTATDAFSRPRPPVAVAARGTARDERGAGTPRPARAIKTRPRSPHSDITDRVSLRRSHAEALGLTLAKG